MDQLDLSSIPGPNRKCMVCDRDLAPITKHPSVLEVDERGEPKRRDICPDCWEKMADRDFFSFWLTQREAPKPDPRLTRQEQNQRLLALFNQMHEAGDERFRPHLYVLAHTLMKRRLLKWEGSEKGQDGVERILFRQIESDEVLRIEEINLQEEGLTAVMRELEGVLNDRGPSNRR